MGYCKVRIEVWCDCDPERTTLRRLSRAFEPVTLFAPKRQVDVVDRPQAIQDEAAMSFFWGRRGRWGSEPEVGPCFQSVPNIPTFRV